MQVYPQLVENPAAQKACALDVASAEKPCHKRSGSSTSGIWAKFPAASVLVNISF